MGVELGGREIGVAEHLLDRPQVTAARQQMGGERMPQRVRAHPVAESRGLGMTQNDLVEPLPRQRAAAEVEEQLALLGDPDQLPAGGAQVDPQRCNRLTADRHEPLLRPLAAGADDAVIEIHVADLEPDRPRRTQPRGIHQPEQGAVPPRHRIVPPRLRQQPLHFAVAQHLRELLAPARGLEPGRGIVLDRLLAPQVAVEGAQAGGLAVDRRGRRGRAPVAVALREVRQEVGEIGGLGLGGVPPSLGQKAAELQQVRAIGGQRVAGEPALELEMSQEVQYERLVALGGLRDGLALGRNRGHAKYFRGRAPVPSRASEQPLQHQQADQRLRVLAASDRAVEILERELDDLDPLAASITTGRAVARPRINRHVIELRGEEEPDALVGEAWARVEALQLPPVARGLADLLGELTLGALQRRLPLEVELARRELEQGRILDRLARLLDHVEGAAVVRDHADGARMDDDLPGRPAAVRVLEGVHADRGDRPPVDELPADQAQALIGHWSAPLDRASACPAISSASSHTASISTMAASVTSSCGVWFASVPLASSTASYPEATSAFASLPPPVATSRGSWPRDRSASEAIRTGSDFGSSR